MSENTTGADKGMTYFMILYLVLYPIITLIFLIITKTRIHTEKKFIGKGRLISL